LRARERRITDERRWQVLVAGLPREYAEELLGLLGDSGERERAEDSGDVKAPSGTPLLHELTEQQVQLMGLPVKFVKVADEEQSSV
jgi:hypothetical protein